MNLGQFQRVAKALADPRRFDILEVIAASGTEMCCGEVVGKFPVAQATISHHLKELADAGLIEARAEGQFRLLRARPEVLAEYIELLQRRIGAKPPAGKASSARGKTARGKTVRG